MSGTVSTLESLLSLTPDERQQLLASLTDEEAEALLYDWRTWARPEQLEPAGDWRCWLVLAGRGYGKTRSGVEWVREQAEAMPGSRGVIGARTIGDFRDICIEGESGLLASLPPRQRPPEAGFWNRSLGELVLWNGTYVKGLTSEEPDDWRGKQAHWGWFDEMAAWKHNREAWRQVPYVVRLPWPGRRARYMVTTTPRPVKEIRELLKAKSTVVTRGSTFDNLANLTADYREMVEELRGTRMGRQELMGEVLDDVPGALWQRAFFERAGFRIDMPKPESLLNVWVAVDPAVTAEEDSDETGIVVAGALPQVDESKLPEFAVLEDLSMRGQPIEWATKACDAAKRWGARITAEVNNGGDLVETVIRQVWPEAPYAKVHASHGKRIRAEPIATLYEQGRVHHASLFDTLEDQLCGYVPGVTKASPDRMDATVWCLTKLLEHRRAYFG